MRRFIPQAEAKPRPARPRPSARRTAQLDHLSRGVFGGMR
jgi:hypothetical protein